MLPMAPAPFNNLTASGEAGKPPTKISKISTKSITMKSLLDVKLYVIYGSTKSKNAQTASFIEMCFLDMLISKDLQDYQLFTNILDSYYFLRLFKQT